MSKNYSFIIGFPQKVQAALLKVQGGQEIPAEKLKLLTYSNPFTQEYIQDICHQLGASLVFSLEEFIKARNNNQEADLKQTVMFLDISQKRILSYKNEQYILFACENPKQAQEELVRELKIDKQIIVNPELQYKENFQYNTYLIIAANVFMKELKVIRNLYQDIVDGSKYYKVVTEARNSILRVKAAQDQQLSNKEGENIKKFIDFTPLQKNWKEVDNTIDFITGYSRYVAGNIINMAPWQEGYNKVKRELARYLSGQSKLKLNYNFIVPLLCLLNEKDNFAPIISMSEEEGIFVVSFELQSSNVLRIELKNQFKIIIIQGKGDVTEPRLGVFISTQQGDIYFNPRGGKATNEELKFFMSLDSSVDTAEQEKIKKIVSIDRVSSNDGDEIGIPTSIFLQYFCKKLILTKAKPLSNVVESFYKDCSVKGWPLMGKSFSQEMLKKQVKEDSLLVLEQSIKLSEQMFSQVDKKPLGALQAFLESGVADKNTLQYLYQDYSKGQQKEKDRVKYKRRKDKLERQTQYKKDEQKEVAKLSKQKAEERVREAAKPGTLRIVPGNQARLAIGFLKLQTWQAQQEVKYDWYTRLITQGIAQKRYIILFQKTGKVCLSSCYKESMLEVAFSTYGVVTITMIDTAQQPQQVKESIEFSFQQDGLRVKHTRQDVDQPENTLFCKEEQRIVLISKLLQDAYREYFETGDITSFVQLEGLPNKLLMQKALQDISTKYSISTDIASSIEELDRLNDESLEMDTILQTQQKKDEEAKEKARLAQKAKDREDSLQEVRRLYEEEEERIKQEETEEDKGEIKLHKHQEISSFIGKIGSLTEDQYFAPIMNQGVLVGAFYRKSVNEQYFLNLDQKDKPNFNDHQVMNTNTPCIKFHKKGVKILHIQKDFADTRQNGLLVRLLAEKDVLSKLINPSYQNGQEIAFGPEQRQLMNSIVRNEILKPRLSKDVDKKLSRPMSYISIGLGIVAGLFAMKMLEKMENPLDWMKSGTARSLGKAGVSLGGSMTNSLKPEIKAISGIVKIGIAFVVATASAKMIDNVVVGLKKVCNKIQSSIQKCVTKLRKSNPIVKFAVITVPSAIISRSLYMVARSMNPLGRKSVADAGIIFVGTIAFGAIGLGSLYIVATEIKDTLFPPKKDEKTQAGPGSSPSRSVPSQAEAVPSPEGLWISSRWDSCLRKVVNCRLTREKILYKEKNIS
jgi:hypothetical protein